MQTRFSQTLIMLAITAAFGAPATTRAQQTYHGSLNASGFYMAADDSYHFLDFAGFSLKLGFYVTSTTEFIGEVSFAEGLDLPEHLDYSTNIGILGGVTQYLPLTPFSSLYLRGKIGVTQNEWEYDSWYLANEYGCRRCAEEETDTYFTCGIGGGISVSLTDTVSIEAGYDYLTMNVSDDTDDSGISDWPGYHIVHIGIDFLF